MNIKRFILSLCLIGIIGELSFAQISNPGGGAATTPGSANIASFGAVAGRGTLDGAVSSKSTTFGATGNSTSPATPSGTTTFNNELLVTAYSYTAALTGPGTPTQRQNITGSSGNWLGIYLGDQTVASAGAYAANTATQVSNLWDSIVIPLIPTSGNTISYVASTSANAHATSLTINKPTGTLTGQTMVMCISNWSNGQWNTGGWTLIGSLVSGSAFLTCYTRIAVAGEPSSYSLTPFISATEQISAAIATYTNVAAIDAAITSATMNFAASDVGQQLCLWEFGKAVNQANSVNASCGPIGIVSNATTAYALLTNITAASLTSTLTVVVPDSTSAFASAVASLTSGGTVLIPPGTYFLTAGNLAIPTTNMVSFIGGGGYSPTFVLGAGNGTAYVPTLLTGSSIIVKGDPANDAAIKYNPGTVASQYAIGPMARVSDLALLSTGEGGDGIDYQGSHAVFERLVIEGFAHDGLQTLGAGTSTFTGFVTIRDNYISGNANANVDVAGGGNSPCCMNITSNELDRAGNGGFPLILTGTAGVNVDNNDIQWSGACAIQLTGGGDGINIRGNWLESGGVCDTSTAALLGPTVIGNHFSSNNTIESNGNCGWVIQGNHANNTPILFSGTFCKTTIDASNVGATDLAKSFTGTAGTASCTYQAQGGAATITCFLSAYANTGAAQTWTFPIALATIPIVSETAGSCGSFNPTATATVLTLPANAGMTAETCQITLQGQTN